MFFNIFKELEDNLEVKIVNDLYENMRKNFNILLKMVRNWEVVFMFVI